MRIRESFLPFYTPAINEDEIREVEATLRSGWLTTGPRVKSFEEEFAKYTGARHALAVNSGTAALHLALDAISLNTNDEVIVPTMTFAATAEVVIYFKARPILVDIDRATMNIDVYELERLLENAASKVQAIIPVHFGGLPCDMSRILNIAGQYNTKVIEDAAHALPAFCEMEGKNKRMIGSIGDITAFSFYATKNITTGEGGMITTEDDGYAEKMRIMSLHGISKDAWKRYTSEGNWYYEIIYAGH
jgi:perosamine synthetase